MNICWHNCKYWPKNDDISGTNELQTNRCSFCKTVDDISKPRRKEEKTSTNKYEGYSFLLAVLWNGYFSVKKEKKLM